MALHMKDGVEFEVPDEPPMAPEPPIAVTPRQLQLALLGAGLLDEIEAFVAALNPTNPLQRAAKISWEYATEYRRDDPMLNQMAGMLDPPITPEQIDQIFIVAAGL